jgi:hypothetical protein
MKFSRERGDALVVEYICRRARPINWLDRCTVRTNVIPGVTFDNRTPPGTGPNWPRQKRSPTSPYHGIPLRLAVSPRDVVLRRSIAGRRVAGVHPCRLRLESAHPMGPVLCRSVRALLPSVPSQTTSFAGGLAQRSTLVAGAAQPSRSSFRF